MGIDWRKSMSQTFEYFVLDAATWREAYRLDGVRGCTVTRDSESDLLVSARLTVTDDPGEVYVRAYLVASQGRETERVPIATFLVQTPGPTHNGKSGSAEAECYSPLVELRDDMPPIGYTVPSGTGCVAAVAMEAAAHCRAPVSMPQDETVLTGDFTAEESDTWLSFCRALLEKAGMRLTVATDGTIGCAPVADAASVAPARSYSDGELSILLPDISDSADWFGLPNVYEAVLSTSDGSLSAVAVNDDPASPLSTVSRGRTVRVRDTSPELPEDPNQADIEAYALSKLREAMEREHRTTFGHGFDGGDVGQGVQVDYAAAGVSRRMLSVSQEIELKTGVSVTETCVWKEAL